MNPPSPALLKEIREKVKTRLFGNRCKSKDLQDAVISQAILKRERRRLRPQGSTS